MVKALGFFFFKLMYHVTSYLTRFIYSFSFPTMHHLKNTKLSLLCIFICFFIITVYRCMQCEYCSS